MRNDCLIVVFLVVFWRVLFSGLVLNLKNRVGLVHYANILEFAVMIIFALIFAKGASLSGKKLWVVV